VRIIIDNKNVINIRQTTTASTAITISSSLTIIHSSQHQQQQHQGNNNNNQSSIIMGNNHSVPRTLLQCKNQKGKLDSQLYYFYTKRKRQIRRNEELDAMIQQCILEANEDANGESSSSKLPQTQRSCFRRNIQYCRTSDDVLIEVTPRTSSWFCTYVKNPMIDDSKFHSRF
jgi:hypothetical protein